jgi:hypothetical protein
VVFLVFADAVDTLYKRPNTYAMKTEDYDPDASDYPYSSDYPNSSDWTDNLSFNPDEADTIQMVFNEIVNIRQEPNDLQRNSGASEDTKPRIIYMRDFASVAPAFMLFAPYLRQAVRNRRTAKFDKDLLCYELQPTVLVLGFAFTPSTKRNEENQNPPIPWFPRASRAQNGHSVSKTSNLQGFTDGGAALRDVLPLLDIEVFDLKRGTLPHSLSPFTATLLLPSLTDREELIASTLSPKLSHTSTYPIRDFISIGPCLSVFPEGSHTIKFRDLEQDMAYSRKQDVRNAWMEVCLGCRGTIVCGKPLSSIRSGSIETSVASDEPHASCLGIPSAVDLLDTLVERTGIPLPVALDRIASIALGISITQLDSTAVIQVTPTAVSTAYQIFYDNWKARSDWLKVVDKSTVGEEVWGGQVKTLDPIVEKVKKSNELNSYEKNLLDCIVDSGNCPAGYTVGVNSKSLPPQADSKQPSTMFVFQKK